MRFCGEYIDGKRELKQILLIFFGGGAIQELIFDPVDMTTFNTAVEAVLLNGTFWVLLSKGSEYLVLLVRWMGFYWVKQPLKTFLVAFSLIIFYTLTAIGTVLFVYLILVKGFTLEEYFGALKWRYFMPALLLTVVINMFMHGRSFLLEWKQAAVEVEKFKNESLKSKYESLKNQVNPHFLFNSLNALSSLVYDDQAKAVDFIRRLSKVYRYVLDNKDKELVPLQEELAFLEDYVFLQKIRFEDSLEINVNNGCDEGMVPPIAIQVLVENAIKHNVVSESKPLKVQIEIDQEYCVVQNNLQDKLHKDSTGIGLSNLKARYEFLSDRKVTVEQGADQFKVTIPILKISQ